MKFFLGAVFGAFVFIFSASCEPINKQSLENISLSEVISKSDTDADFLKLANNVIQLNFNKKALKIRTPFVEATSVHMNETDDFIEIQHFETAEKLLKKFGGLIPNITVEYREVDNNNKVDTINKLINSQCADNLVQFDVLNYKTSFFNEVAKPFKKVQHLSLNGHFENLSTIDLCFGDIFPSVKNLTLKYVYLDINANVTACLDRKFTHLEHLVVYLNLIKRPNTFNEESIEKLFKKNPQIRRLSLSGISPYILSAAALELPKLEELRVDFYVENSKDGKPYNTTTKQIHFNNVKKFLMKGSSHSIPSNIHFKNLVEFQIDPFPKACPRWIDFIESNEHLEKIQIRDHYLNHSEFSRIAEAKLNLIEVSVECGFSVDSELIAKFIGNHKRLKKFDVKFISDDVANMQKNELQKTIDKKWKIVKYSNIIVIEPFSLSELISKSDTDADFSKVANNVIQQKFIGKSLKIRTPFVTDSTHTKETDDFIEIQHFETVKRLLKKFGDTIPNITVEYRQTDNDEKADSINKLINLQCANTLVQFDVYNYKNHFFNEMTNPLPAVQHLLMQGYFENLGTPLCFGEIFPSVQHLTLKHINTSNVTCLDRTWKHMKHLNVILNIIKIHNFLDEELIATFLKKNPQIQKLSLSGISPYLLNVAANELSNLEELNIDYFFDDFNDSLPHEETQKTILFENVKTLSIQVSPDSIFSIIHFRNLRELQTNFVAGNISRWLDFIKRNDHLEKLQIKRHRFYHDDFSKFAAADLNLVEVKIECSDNIKDELIVSFIKNNRQLQKFSLQFASEDFANATKYVLQENIDKEWNIIQYSNNIVLNKQSTDPNHSNSYEANTYFIYLIASVVLVFINNRL